MFHSWVRGNNLLTHCHTGACKVVAYITLLYLFSDYEAVFYVYPIMYISLPHIHREGKISFDVDFSYCWLNLEVSWYSLEQYIGCIIRQAFNYYCSLQEVVESLSNYTTKVLFQRIPAYFKKNIMSYDSVTLILIIIIIISFSQWISQWTQRILYNS